MSRLFFLSMFFILYSCKEATDLVNPSPTGEKIIFEVPENFPPIVYDLTKNPISEEGFELGRALFYDGLLSRDGTVSCGTCHQQGAAFTHHGHDLSHGIEGRLGARNASSLQNMAWQTSFFWDGGVHHLDLQPISAIENPTEMDEDPQNVLEKLRNHPDYPTKFRRVFGEEGINTENFLKALSQFTLMLVSANSRYDKYIRNETENEFNEDELAGLALVRQKCTPCHNTDLFTDLSYRNNGLDTLNKQDRGRYEITFNQQDRFKFKVPSLRNIARTAPYMHDGRFNSLQKVLNHYSHEVTDSPTLDPLLKQNKQLGIPLSEQEKKQIIAFLQTLTDYELLENPMFYEFNATIN